MSTENVQKFFEILAQDPIKVSHLQQLKTEFENQSVNAAGDSGFIEKHILSMADDMELSFTIDDFKEYGAIDFQQADGPRDLSDAELDAVAGGLDILGWISDLAERMRHNMYGSRCESGSSRFAQRQ